MDIDLSGLSISNVRVAVATPHVTPRDTDFQACTDRVVISAHMEVLDRDTGKPTQVAMRETVDWLDWSLRDEDARVWWVRSLVVRFVAHEALEHFKVNGVRRFDPHEKEEL